MNKKYIHERMEWPDFRWDWERLTLQLAAVHRRQGSLFEKMEALGFPLRKEAVLESITEEVRKSSEIEGEHLDKEQVRSSIARRLGMDTGALVIVDRNVDGVVEMMLDATQRYEAPLTVERLFAWHSSLFPTGRSGIRPIKVGAWRDDSTGPMQVVSGPMGRERVHYEAPPTLRLGQEIEGFLTWFESPERFDPVLKAAVAHLWFVTLHPFDDGNGRIARALAELALARSEQSTQRYYSMSAQIRKERSAYYDILEVTQQGDLDLTPWMTWFLTCLERAIDQAEITLGAVLAKARFWQAHAGIPINERQQRLLNRLLDGFDGKLTTSKWAKIATCSQDTAYRDILDLIAKGMLAREDAGGRTTSYALRLPGSEVRGKTELP